MLMCAINPADINQIQGTCTCICNTVPGKGSSTTVLCICIVIFVGVYAIRPPLPAVGGGEGVGVVTSVGADVTTLSKGDWVVLSKPGMGEMNNAVFESLITRVMCTCTYVGVWRTSIVASAECFMRISETIPLQMAATLSVNPTTAYRMLKDFVALKPGI